MKVFQILLLIFGLSIMITAQNMIVSGVLTDSAKTPVSKTKVTLTDEKQNSISTLTNDEGFYIFKAKKGNYTLEFFPQYGFEIVKIINFSIKNKSVKFDLSLNIDLTGVMATDIVCKFDKVDSQNADCKLVSSQKNGERIPRLIDFRKKIKH